MEKRDEAIALHDKGFNCCQSVACAFSEELGIDKSFLFRACEGFGRGMGGMEGDCGALSGAIMLAGLVKSDGNTDMPMSKAETYDLSEKIYNVFVKRTGSPICRELRGEGREVPLCSCPDCIRHAVDVAKEMLSI